MPMDTFSAEFPKYRYTNVADDSKKTIPMSLNTFRKEYKDTGTLLSQ